MAWKLTICDEWHKMLSTITRPSSLKELQIMNGLAATKKSKTQQNKQCLGILRLQAQLRLIQKPVLQNLTHCPTDPTVCQAGTWRSEGGWAGNNWSQEDTAEWILLKSGLENLFCFAVSTRWTGLLQEWSGFQQDCPRQIPFHDRQNSPLCPLWSLYLPGTVSSSIHTKITSQTTIMGRDLHVRTYIFHPTFLPPGRQDTVFVCVSLIQLQYLRVWSIADMPRVG